MKWIFLSVVILVASDTYSQSFIKHDTLTLHQKDFSDSSSIKKLIDQVFDHKEENLQRAIDLGTYALNRASEIKNKRLQAGALNLMAAAHEDQGQYQLSLKLNYQALKLFELINDTYGTAMVTGNLGRVYMQSGKLKDAVTYLSKAENLSIQTRQNKVLLYVYANLANVYTQLGDFKKALAYALKDDSLNIRSHLNIKLVQARNDGNIGAIYFYMKDYRNALKYYNQAKSTALQAKDSITYYMQLINIGELSEMDHKADALPAYLQALHYFEKNKDYSDLQYVANDISAYYTSRGKYQLALQYYQQSVKANEHNTGIQAAKNMALLQTQYETEKKEQRINLLNKENTIQKLSIASRNKTIGIIIGLFLLAGVFGALFYNRNKLKQKAALQQQMLKQQEQLAAAVIEAEEKERKRIASDLHDGVGQLFSAVRMNLSGLLERVKIEREEDQFLAEKTVALVDESCKEVRVISHQMMPNMLLRSGIASDVKNFIEKIDSERLKVNVEANGFKNRLESNVETVLYRVIQETVNNVIKHSKASKLDIILNREAAGIKAEIADNGVGFNTALIGDFEGIGLKNIITRIEYLKGTVKYESSPGSGTRVKIWVPVV